VIGGRREHQLRILIVGHTCSPFGGSEPGATWNWGWHLAALGHEVWILAHPQYKDQLERLDRSLLLPNLHIVWVNLPRWRDPWRPERSESGLRLHYLFWQRHALSAARRLAGQARFDVVHQVGLSSISAASPFWKLGRPFIWGPLGGGQVCPRSFLRYFRWRRRSELLRAFRVRLLPYLPALRRALDRSSLVLVSNRETYNVAVKAGARRVELFPDNGIRSSWLLETPPPLKKNTSCVLAWVGRLEPHKGLDLALEAIAAIRSKASVTLEVIGDGPLYDDYSRRICELGLEGWVHLRGRLEHQQVRRHLLAADGFLFTSLRDSFGTVVLEAMGLGLPVIAFDRQGPGWFVAPEAGFKVPLTTPAETVARLGDAIFRFAKLPPSNRHRMGIASWELAKTQTWERRAAWVVSRYAGILGGNQDRSTEANGCPFVVGGVAHGWE